MASAVLPSQDMRPRFGAVALSIGIIGGPLFLAACSGEPAAPPDPSPEASAAVKRETKKPATERRTATEAEAETAPTETQQTTPTATPEVPRAPWAESGISKCICDSVIAKCSPRCAKVYCSGAAADGSDEGACADCDRHASDGCTR